MLDLPRRCCMGALLVVDLFAMKGRWAANSNAGSSHRRLPSYSGRVLAWHLEEVLAMGRRPNYLPREWLIVHYIGKVGPWTMRVRPALLH